MKSLISHLGTQKFPAFSIGIGKSSGEKKDTISHVLGKFSSVESEVVNEVFIVDKRSS